MDDSVRELWSAARPTKDHVVDAACVAPWVSIEFDPSGWVYACCTSGLYPLGRIGEDRLRDLWGGPRAQVLREAMRSWDLTVACGPCRWHLEHGRMDPVASVYDQYPLSSPDPAEPHMMLFALSNRCNLGCIMCTPELSTTLRQEAHLPPLQSRYDDEFFEDLEPLLAKLKLAKFLGGEPFLAPEHKRVWSMFDQLAAPPQMQVTTNGTIWTDYVEWVLDRFPVDISISIDAATATTYEQIRRGGNYHDLMVNVARFDEVCRARGTELHVSYCLMDRNWQELATFLAWADQFEVPASINLVTDDGLAIHDAPIEGLLEIRAQWEADEASMGADLGKNRGVWDTQRAQLESVIEERYAGITPAPRQAQPAPPGLFEMDARDPSDLRSPIARRRRRHADLAVIEDHRGRLGRWAGGSSVGQVAIGSDGQVEVVDEELDRLGITTTRLRGCSASDLVPVMEEALGCPGWIVEVAELDGCMVRTLVLSNDRPVRGARGSIVRTIQVPVGQGWTILIAEDRMYERRNEVPVALGRSKSIVHPGGGDEF